MRLKQVPTIIWGWLRAVVTLSMTPPRWRPGMYAALGVMGGVGLVLLRVSEFTSYLSDSPRTCINCHIMTPQYITWQRSSHRFAACNDCHVPHDNIVRKYAFKASDGLRHATIFTLRREPQVIEAHPPSQRVIRDNCRRCHGAFVSGVPSLAAKDQRCVRCHRDVPHGDVHSLAATPNVPFPRLRPVTSNPFAPHKDDPVISHEIIPPGVHR